MTTKKEMVQTELIEMGKLGLLNHKDIPSIFRQAEKLDYNDLAVGTMNVSEIATLIVELN